MTDRPRPSEIHIRAWAVPFTDCFGRTEKEIAAGLYVEACLARGDTWQPIAPRQLGETLLALVNLGEQAPTWATFIRMTGLHPDVLGLVEGGWFTKSEADQSIEPTDLFFAKIDTPRWVKRL